MAGKNGYGMDGCLFGMVIWDFFKDRFGIGFWRLLQRGHVVTRVRETLYDRYDRQNRHVKI